jgi:hypothetical protein
MDITEVSEWFSLKAGFKVHAQCPDCHSPRIAFHTNRTPGLKGITLSSQGLAPACIDCGKSLPSHRKKASKNLQGFTKERKFY